MVQACLWIPDNKSSENQVFVRHVRLYCSVVHLFLIPFRQWELCLNLLVPKSVTNMSNSKSKTCQFHEICLYILLFLQSHRLLWKWRSWNWNFSAIGVRCVAVNIFHDFVNLHYKKILRNELKKTNEVVLTAIHHQQTVNFFFVKSVLTTNKGALTLWATIVTAHTHLLSCHFYIVT